MVHNLEIRKAIEKKRLRYYEVAKACGVNAITFSRWLRYELDDEKKKFILKRIKEIKL